MPQPFHIEARNIAGDIDRAAMNALPRIELHDDLARNGRRINVDARSRVTVGPHRFAQPSVERRQVFGHGPFRLSGFDGVRIAGKQVTQSASWCGQGAGELQAGRITAQGRRGQERRQQML